MKKALVISILGIAATIVQSYGAGEIFIYNYASAPYNQVVAFHTAVNDPNVVVQIWYGKGNISDPSLLTPGITTSINPAINYDPGAGYGPGGYFLNALQVLPDWNPGDVYTFQLRGSVNSGPVLGSSVLWQEQNEIRSTAVPAHFSDVVPRLDIGQVIPEPSLFALTASGVAAFIFFHRRR